MIFTLIMERIPLTLDGMLVRWKTDRLFCLQSSHSVKEILNEILKITINVMLCFVFFVFYTMRFCLVTNT